MPAQPTSPGPAHPRGPVKPARPPRPPSFAALIAYKNGHTASAIEEAVIGGVSSAMGAVFILLAVGALIAAGAVISGGYVGDKMSPLSETTVLVPQLVGGVTTNQHIRGMLWTVVPSFGLAFGIFLGCRRIADGSSARWR